VTRAIDLPEKESYLLVTFTYGDPADPDFAYYTNWSQDQGIFTSMPTMKITVPKNVGIVEEAPCKIEMGSDAFTDRLCDGSPHSEVKVQVEEVTRGLDGGPAALRLLLFTGTIIGTIKASKGRSNNRSMTCRMEKNFYDVPLGIPTEHHCVFVFNGFGCDSGTIAGGGPTNPGSVSTTILAIDGKKVTTTTAPPAPSNVQYLRGFMRKDGVTIEIRDFDASVSGVTFYMVRKPPADWVGAAVTLQSGCHGTIDRCREWDNEQNFGGWGAAIPAYNPSFEDSP
jgi:hypothetical protein